MFGRKEGRRGKRKVGILILIIFTKGQYNLCQGATRVVTIASRYPGDLLTLD